MSIHKGPRKKYKPYQWRKPEKNPLPTGRPLVRKAEGVESTPPLLKYEDYANNELECLYGCRHVYVERDDEGYPFHRHGEAGYREHHPMVPIGERLQ